MKRTAAFVAVLPLALALSGARAAPAQPSNDNRAAAAKIVGLPAGSFVDFPGATAEPGEDTSCGGGASVWYTWRAKGADPLTVRAMPQHVGPFSFPQVGIHVYRQVRAELTSVVCGINNLTFSPEPGTHYVFRIATGENNVNIQWRRGPALETIATADNIISPPFPFTEIIGLGNALEADEPRPTCGVPEGSAWYAFASDATRLVDVHIDAVVPFYFQVYTVGGDGSLEPFPNGCRSTLAPHRSGDVFVPMLAGDKIYVQYGHNIDPAANQGFNARFGFFSLTQVV